MPEIKGTEFHVLLGDIKLSADAEARIEQGIQSLVMSELSAYKPDPNAPDKKRPKKGPFVVIPPIPWPGFIIRDIRDLSTLKDNVLEMEKLAQQVNFMKK